MPGQISIPYTFIDHPIRRTGLITKSPFTCGRMPDNDLVLNHPYISRRHAKIICEGDISILIDLGSSHGTYVNGEPVAGRHALQAGCKIAFGNPDGPVLEFGVGGPTSTSTIRSIIEQLPEVGSANNSIEKLHWFFDAARKLTGEDGIDQILASLLEITLELTRVERGYVFLRSASGELNLAMGRDCGGQPLFDDSTISHSVIRQALQTAREFIITDTLQAEHLTDSMVAQRVRSIVCILLRSHRKSHGETTILGVLYLDSRLKPGSLSDLDNNLLHTIATDAAALIDNTQLALAEENERRYREELNVAAHVQSSLMTAQFPTPAFAAVTARSIPCRDIGGDFFLALADDQSLTVVVADVSGKGISAAILASTMQGMLHALLRAHQPLDQIASALNLYICEKDVGKYATMAIFCLHPDGTAEYINCGHIPPYICSRQGAFPLAESNLPVGLIPHATFLAANTQLDPGSRLLIVTDGVTEAADESGEFFGEERLAAGASKCTGLNDLFLELQTFCQSHPQDDDLTILEVRYTG